MPIGYYDPLNPVHVNFKKYGEQVHIRLNEDYANRIELLFQICTPHTIKTIKTTGVERNIICQEQ